MHILTLIVISGEFFNYVLFYYFLLLSYFEVFFRQISRMWGNRLFVSLIKTILRIFFEIDCDAGMLPMISKAYMFMLWNVLKNKFFARMISKSFSKKSFKLYFRVLDVTIDPYMIKWIYLKGFTIYNINCRKWRTKAKTIVPFENTIITICFSPKSTQNVIIY